MSSSPAIRKPLKTILRDHELWVEYIEKINQIFADNTPAAAKSACAATRRFIDEQILAHFAEEEQHIFPALLAANLGEPVVQRIADLRRDHQQFVNEITDLSKRLADPGSPDLRKALTDFGIRLQKHAAKENSLFPSLL